MVVECSKVFGLIYIIYFDNPITEEILQNLFEVYFFFYLLIISPNNEEYLVLRSIGSGIIIIGILIFLELIVFNFCKMNENTKEAIIMRSDEELKKVQMGLMSLMSNHDISDDAGII